MRELEAVEQRIEGLEAFYKRLLRVAILANRLYRRLGHLLLSTPLAGLCQKWMGEVAPQAKYRRWLILHRATDRYAQCRGGDCMTRNAGPLISIVMPVFQPRLPWLKSAVSSVQEQSYQRWQLLVVPDGDPAAEVLGYLQSVVREDPRIQCISGEHQGISSALNLGLHAARGTYTAILDQDDLLEQSALQHVAAVLRRDDPDILYTDEDYVDEDGCPQLPIFKPGWSPALLLSCMYLSHFLVVHTERARAIGGFRTAHDGAQDYDLVLRLTDKPANVVHIPRVLYHWRQHRGSTALDPAAKPYTQSAGRRALEEALARRGLDAAVRDGHSPNSYQWTYSGFRPAAATIVIPTRNPKLLERVLGSIRGPQDGSARPVHAVLHCCGDGNESALVDIAARFGAQVTEYRGPFNFSLMNNLAAATASSPYLVFLNDDVVVRGDAWLDELCAPFMRPEVGVVGAQMHYFDGTIQHSGIVLGMGDGVGHAGRFQVGSPFWPWLALTRNVSAATGACLAIRRSLFEKLGGFDTRLSDNYNDVDLCLKAQRAGFEVVLSCGLPLAHEEGRTRKTGTHLAERIALWTRWGRLLGRPDYFYSPNLSRRFETIELSTFRQ